MRGVGAKPLQRCGSSVWTTSDNWRILILFFKCLLRRDRRSRLLDLKPWLLKSAAGKVYDSRLARTVRELQENLAERTKFPVNVI